MSSLAITFGPLCGRAILNSNCVIRPPPTFLPPAASFRGAAPLRMKIGHRLRPVKNPPGKPSGRAFKLAFRKAFRRAFREAFRKASREAFFDYSQRAFKEARDWMPKGAESVPKGRQARRYQGRVLRILSICSTRQDRSKCARSAHVHLVYIYIYI